MADLPEPGKPADAEVTEGAPQAPEPDGPAPAAVAAETGAVPDAEAGLRFEQRARLAEARLTEVLAAYRQLKAGDDAFRERTTRTIERRFEGRHERLLLKFIDVLDNFDRALEATEQTYAGQPLIEGLILVRAQLLQTLQQEGLERIPVLGLPFDPHLSEAMGVEPVDDPDRHGVVVKELQRGYRIRGRLARASRVVLGRYAEGVVAGAEGVKASSAAGEGVVVAVEGAPETAAEPKAAAPEDAPPEASAAPVLAAYDYPDPLRPTPPAEPEDERPESEAEAGGSVKPTPVDDEGPTLEEIIARAEAQQALFGEAFEGDAAGGAEEPEGPEREDAAKA